MTKREILEFINAKRIIEENQKYNNVTLSKLYQGFINDSSLIKWFIDKDKVKKDFDVLKEEIEEALANTKLSESDIEKLRGKCNHEVRLKEYNAFGYSYRCVFCEKYIARDDYFSWEDSVNRNRHSVTFSSNVSYDEFGNESFIPNGYSVNQIYDFIISIVNDKPMDEEIDLVEEFKKSNFNCVIRDEKFSKEDYILILSGSNKERVLDNGYISRDYNYQNSIKFLKYFKDMLNIKVCFVSSEDIIKMEKIDSYGNLKVIQYNDLNSLFEALKIVKEIPFKCVLDFSSLFTFSINLNSLEMLDYSVDFKDIFPNSLCFEDNSFNEQEIQLFGSEESYNGSVEEVCNSVRKLIKNKR